MTATNRGRVLAAERLRAAEDAANELREAVPTPLVGLDRCTPDTAHRLAAALRGGDAR